MYLLCALANQACALTGSGGQAAQLLNWGGGLVHRCLSGTKLASGVRPAQHVRCFAQSLASCNNVLASAGHVGLVGPDALTAQLHGGKLVGAHGPDFVVRRQVFAGLGIVHCCIDLRLGRPHERDLLRLNIRRFARNAFCDFVCHGSTPL